MLYVHYLANLQEFAYTYGLVHFSVCVCVYACVCVTIVRTGHTLAKIKNVQNTFVDLDIYHLVASKFVLRILDLLSKVKESRHFNSGERPYKCDECEYFCTSHSYERLYKCDECKYCCIQSSSVARHKLIHSCKHLFKCDECEFKCDEDDICSKANHQLTCHQRVRHLKIVLPALHLRDMVTCLPINSLDLF